MLVAPGRPGSPEGTSQPTITKAGTLMVSSASLACQSAPRENSGETYAARIARIANSPDAQAVVDQAPPFTRQQLDVARAACASATARFRERETVPVAMVIGDGCPCGCEDGQDCIRNRPILAKGDWTVYENHGRLHAGQCIPRVCGRAA